MIKKLKSAYELASQRVIVSKYAEEIAAEDKREKERRYEIDALPDFVDDWARPDKGTSHSLTIEESGQSSFHSRKEIELYQKKQQEEQITKEKYMVPQQEKITINFNENPMEIHWYGHFTSYSGFSRQNRAYAFGLSNKNTKVKVDIQEGTVDINNATHEQLKTMAKTEISPSAPKVYGATVPLRLAHGGPKILYTMMETSQSLHKGYVDKINLYDEIWVPTQQGKELFKANGVRPNIRVMPLGVDTVRYNPNARPMRFDCGLKRFVFLSVFKWGYRKGYDVLLKAFMEEFSASDDVSLLIVSRTDVNHKPEIIMEDFKNIRNGILKKDGELPHIALYDKPIKEKDMPGVYSAADAFILMSRGEGFCLPIYEAGACNLPIISTNCSGQAELLNHENSYLVEPEGYSEARINGNMSRLAKHCGFYEDQLFPNFGRESIEQAKEHMRTVYDDYDGAKDRVNKLGKIIRENYTWDTAVDRVYARLREF